MNVPRYLLMAGAVVCACVAQANVMPEPLSDLVVPSDQIVLARVISVSEGADGLKRARADVREVWKGRPDKEVTFLASRTWACDISFAEAGESVVLFLVWSESRGEFVIALSGRGRMPLRDVQGRSFATIWVNDVLLPEGTPTIDGPDEDYESIRSIEFDLLKKLVSEAVNASDANQVVDE